MFLSFVFGNPISLRKRTCLGAKDTVQSELLFLSLCFTCCFSLSKTQFLPRNSYNLRQTELRNLIEKFI